MKNRLIFFIKNFVIKNVFKMEKTKRMIAIRVRKALILNEYILTQKHGLEILGGLFHMKIFISLKFLYLLTGVTEWMNDAFTDKVKAASNEMQNHSWDIGNKLVTIWVVCGGCSVLMGYH